MLDYASRAIFKDLKMPEQARDYKQFVSVSGIHGSLGVRFTLYLFDTDPYVTQQQT